MPVALIVLLIFLHVRDDGRYAQSPLKGWFDNLKSIRGACCSDADGALVKDADWETKDGHYRVLINGKWIDVPEDALITEPNKYGPAMVWGYPLNGGKDYYLRCFIPGSMT